MAISPNAKTVWEDGPLASPSQPQKSEIRSWGTQIEKALPALMIYDSKSIMGDISVPSEIHSIQIKGNAVAGDGNDGIYIDANSGSSDTFISADGRTWYRAGSRADTAYFRHNNTANFGADPSGVINASASWLAAKADPRPVYVNNGTFRLDLNFDLGIDTYICERGVAVIAPDGSQGRALLNGLGTWDWFDNYISQPDRAVLRTHGFSFKADNFADDGKTDHGLQTDIYWYDRPAPITAVGGVMYRQYSQYGSVNANAQGSLIGSEIELQIYRSSKAGRTFANEINPLAAWAVAQNLYPGSLAGLAMYHDFDMVGPVDPEVFLSTVTAAGRKHNPISTLANASGPGVLGYYGSYLINAVTNPQIGGFGAPQITTYPYSALLLLSGFTGATAVTDGINASATPAAEYAILIGRHGGQWTNGVTTRSKFTEGIRIEDFVSAAMSTAE